MGFGIIIMAVELLLVVGLVAGGVALFRSVTSNRLASAAPPGAAPEGGPRRLLTYLLAFAGVMGVLYAVAGLLAVGVATPLLHSSTLISMDDLRSRASFYLAALIVGTPLWWGAWRAAQRRALASVDERTARERRLFLAAVCAVTAVMALFAAQTLLQYLLTLPAPAAEQTSAVTGIAAAARLAVYGVAWLLYTRFVRAEVTTLSGHGAETTSPVRPSGTHDEAHDLAIYVVAGFALSFLCIGGFQAVQSLAGDLAAAGQPLLVSATGPTTWAVWGAIAAWLIAGGVVWVAVWTYDTRRGGARLLRVAYLYIVVLAAAPSALGGTIDFLYEALRRIAGGQGGTLDWAFLPNTLPYMVVGGLVWAGHWLVVRRQPAPGGQLQADEPAGSIPWPRRPLLALLSLAGLATAAPALISLVWLVLDLAFNPRAALSGPDWWHDQLSLGLAAGSVGLVVWLGAWSILQRAARMAPAGERGADARRLLVGAVVVSTILVAAGFLVALLWLVLQGLLGAPGDASTPSQALQDLATVLVLGGLAAWYGQILRGDLRLGATRRAPVRVVTLVAQGAAEALGTLRERGGRRVEVAGYLVGEALTCGADPAALTALLAALPGAAPGAESALVVLRPDGAQVYPYAKTAPRLAPQPQDAVPTEPLPAGI